MICGEFRWYISVITVLAESCRHDDDYRAKVEILPFFWGAREIQN